MSGDQAFAQANEKGFWEECKDGARDCAPIIFAASPFGALFGAKAIADGLSVGETLFASLSMYAGASQFVMLEVLGLGVPFWSVMLAVFAVNFRHILYSASLGRKFTLFSGTQKWLAFFLMTDPQWATSEARHEAGRLTPAYYLTYGLILYVIWFLSTLLGVTFGSLITNPEAFGFDLLLPIYFLTILMGFRQRPLWLTTVCVSGLASIAVYLTLGAPWHISLGALVGIVVAASMPVSDAVGRGHD